MSEPLLAVAARAAGSALDQGRSEAEIVIELTGMGLSEADARSVIKRLQFGRQNAADETTIARRVGEGYRQQMTTGAVLLVGGIGFTAWSMSGARAGGTVWISWGAILAGVIWLIQGLVGWLKHA